jgi:hypothetical protein
MDLNNPTERLTVVREIAEVINRNSLERPSNTPDFALAEMLVAHLEVFNKATRAKGEYWGEQSLPKNQSQANGRKTFFRT